MVSVIIIENIVNALFFELFAHREREKLDLGIQSMLYKKAAKLDMEKYRVKELVRLDFCPPLNIDASEADVIKSSLKQNFVPIVDSRNTLSGILTRRVVIEYLAEKNGIANS